MAQCRDILLRADVRRFENDFDYGATVVAGTCHLPYLPAQIIPVPVQRTSDINHHIYLFCALRDGGACLESLDLDGAVSSRETHDTPYRNAAASHQRHSLSDVARLHADGGGTPLYCRKAMSLQIIFPHGGVKGTLVYQSGKYE